MTRRSGAGSTACWFVLAAGMAGVVAYEMAEDVSFAPTVTAAPIEIALADPDVMAVMIVEGPSSDVLNDIVERPLFSVSRRPAEAIVEKPDEIIVDSGQKLALQLVGTMLSGASRVVLLKHPTEGLLRLRHGQEVEGWVIGAIDHQRVELRNGDEVEWLKLRTDLLLPKSRKQRQVAPIGSSKVDRKAAILPSSVGGVVAPAKK